MTKKRLPLITAIISTAVTILATLAERSIPNGGERFPGYDLVQALKVPTIILVIAGAATALGSYIALGINRKPKSNVEFTKLYKFIQMRRFALIIAAIPGAVFLPITIGFFGYSAFPPGTFVFGLIAALSMGLLLPGIASMIALLVLAIIIAFKEPIDPETPRPKPHLLQIVLAVITTIILTAGFLQMELTAFNCDTTCNMFDQATMIYLTFYLVCWIALAAVWLNSKRGKPTA